MINRTFRSNPEILAKTGTGSGSLRIKIIVFTSRNVYAKFHQNCSNGCGDIRVLGREEE